MVFYLISCRVTIHTAAFSYINNGKYLLIFTFFIKSFMKIVAAKCISNFYPQNKEYVPSVCVLLFSFVFLAVMAQPLDYK